MVVPWHSDEVVLGSANLKLGRLVEVTFARRVNITSELQFKRTVFVLVDAAGNGRRDRPAE